MIKKNVSVKRYAVMILLIWALIGTGADAEIFTYTDEDGVMHFTDSPSKEEMVLFIRNNPESRRAVYHCPDRYNDIILQAARVHNLSFSLIKALIKVESNFNPHAVSKVGAKGLMQIMPKNMKELNIDDPFNPYENIMGGSRYLRKMLNRFDGQLVLALAAYNAGPTAVERYKDIPPYTETRRFVEKVIKYNYHYR
ncbi:lytic transglycosylase domain-containing protein [Desulfatiferula olefinivorans]